MGETEEKVDAREPGTNQHLSARANLHLPRAPVRSFERDDLITAVEAAVRAVLAERDGSAIVRAALAPRSVGHSAARPAITRPASDCLFFAEKLLSVRRLESLPSRIRVIQIGPGTVVTPLAALELKRQGITIGRRPMTVCPSDGGATPALTESRWAIAVDSKLGTVQAWRRALLQDASPWCEINASLDEVACWLLDEEGRGAMWVTPEVALTVWRSCRVPGVRAAAAAEPTELRSAARSLGMNLLVVDPAGKSIGWLKQLASAFRLAGPPRLPENLLAEGQR